jgi:hypothetical protein
MAVYKYTEIEIGTKNTKQKGALQLPGRYLYVPTGSLASSWQSNFSLSCSVWQTTGFLLTQRCATAKSGGGDDLVGD